MPFGSTKDAENVHKQLFPRLEEVGTDSFGSESVLGIGKRKRLVRSMRNGKCTTFEGMNFLPILPAYQGQLKWSQLYSVTLIKLK